MNAVNPKKPAPGNAKVGSTDVEFYRSWEAVESYSRYYLLREEKYLFRKFYRPGQTVLDLACGLGRTTVLLHEMGMQVRGIDLSEVLIEHARRRFPYIAFDVGSYSAIDAPDESYDHVLISFNSIDHAYPVTERVQALRECFRVLKAGGTFTFSSHNLKALHMSPFLYRRVPWMLRNSLRAFREQAYLVDFGLHLSYAAPEYVIRQAESEGFRLVAMVGFRLAKNFWFNKYLSPYIHYAWEKSR